MLRLIIKILIAFTAQLTALLAVASPIQLKDGGGPYYLTLLGQVAASEQVDLDSFLDDSYTWIEAKQRTHVFKHQKDRGISAWTKIELINDSSKGEFVLSQSFGGFHIKAWVVWDDGIYYHIDSDLKNSPDFYTPERYIRVRLPPGKSVLYVANIHKDYALSNSSLTLWQEESSFHDMQARTVAVSIALTALTQFLGLSILLFSLLMKSPKGLLYGICFMLGNVAMQDILISGNLFLPNRLTDQFYYFVDASILAPISYTFFVSFFVLSLVPEKKYLMVPTTVFAITTLVLKFAGSFALHNISILTVHISTLTFLVTLFLARKGSQRKYIWYFAVGHGFNLATSLYYALQLANVRELITPMKYTIMVGFIVDAIVTGLYIVRNFADAKEQVITDKALIEKERLITKIKSENTEMLLNKAKQVEKNAVIRSSIMEISDHEASISLLAESLDRVLAIVVKNMDVDALFIIGLDSRRIIMIRSSSGLTEGEILELTIKLASDNLLSSRTEDGRHIEVMEQEAYSQKEELHSKLSTMIIGVVCKDPISPFYKELISFVLTSSKKAAMNTIMIEHYMALANVDQLSGLYNKNYEFLYFTELKRMIARGDPYYSMILIDVNDLKKHNDTYGHSTGDSMIKTMGMCISKEKRVTDYAFRFGGDEFLMVLPGTDPVQAEDIAERIRRRTTETPFDIIEDEEVVDRAILSIAIGVATYTDELGSPEKVKSEADRRMYLDKKRVKNAS